MNLVSQSADVLNKRYVITTAIPAAAPVVMFLLMQFACPLSKKRLAEMKTQMNRA